jgi:hypothetical protein
MKPARNIMLTALSIALLAAFFLLPQNRNWMAGRVLRYWKDFTVQKDHLDPEHRKIERYQFSYTYSKRIADYFVYRKMKDQVLVLLPPASYFAAHGIKYPVPEPAVFYYFTGLRTVWATSPEAINANWYVAANNGTVRIDSVSDKKALEDTIRSYNQYAYKL